MSVRYLIVIDDLKKVKVWSDIASAFPENNKGSRVIVTTSILSIATTCAYGSWVYKMQCLQKDDSENLFWNEVFKGANRIRTPDLDRGSVTIIDKCDGLPLALVSAAKYLNCKRHALSGSECKKVGLNLGNHLASEGSFFKEIKRVLAECYDSLPDHGHRMCLLSISMFPRGHRIRRKSLLRRWLAEGLVVSQIQLNEEDAEDRFKEFIDRNIIEAVDIGNELEAKHWRVHGVMLEFISHKSISDNFITFIGNDRSTMSSNGRVLRRLSIYNRTAKDTTTAEKMEVSREVSDNTQ
jgi:disease resistance protein RPM1